MGSLLNKKWQILSSLKSSNANSEPIIETLLENRDLRGGDKDKFLSPQKPYDISWQDLGISKADSLKALKRVGKAIEDKEKIVIYGDYDADGISASAILWEALHGLKADVMPHVPERFSEGYGLNPGSVLKLSKKYPNLKLIITVDNGISAFEGVEKARKLGIDVIITDHHEKSKKLPGAYSIIHTIKTSGSGLAWFFSKALGANNGLELAAIGTISDQVPLIGINRSLVKYGLEELRKTSRRGLLALFEEAGIKRNEINPYTVGFLIAPRLNAMGRMLNAIESLRLLCTKNPVRANELARLLGKTNKERQEVVDKVILHAKELVKEENSNGFILVSHESYHEGVIGLAASKLVEEFYRPAIVMSLGKEISKASARSIPGVNIFEVVKKLDKFLVSGGGHEMAAGFSIRTEHLEVFKKKLSDLSEVYLTKELLRKSLKIDMEIQFPQINQNLQKSLTQFEPFGIGNPTPTFMSKSIKVKTVRSVGADGRHLKLKLSQEGKEFEAIAFGFGAYLEKLSQSQSIDAVYSIEEDGWNGIKKLQLKIKDIQV
jgi:single-stranded-DNA-specific exonuclease